jgi:hypothetical protein
MIEYALVVGFAPVRADVLLLGPVLMPAAAILTRHARQALWWARRPMDDEPEVKSALTLRNRSFGERKTKLGGPCLGFG